MGFKKGIIIFARLFQKSKKQYKMDAIKFVDEQQNNPSLPAFKSGDNVSVHYKIKEGNKERIQVFQGVVLQKRNSGVAETFTVRKMSSGIGVERIFPVYSPFLDKVVVNSRGVVRRARIFYLRGLTGKKARIKTKH